MDITIDYIKQHYKFHTFTLYHIKGKKWGCTLDFKNRIKNQGYCIDDVYETKEVIGVEVADRLEKILNEKEGYSYNHTQSYLINLYRRVKNSHRPKKYNKTKIDRGDYKLSNRHKKHIAIGLRRAYKEGRRSEQDVSFRNTKEYRDKLSDAQLKNWSNPKRKLKQAKGEDNGMSVLKNEDVRFIRKHYYRIKNQYEKIPAGMYSTKQLMTKFNCSKAVILNIINGKNYTSVK